MQFFSPFQTVSGITNYRQTVFTPRGEGVMRSNTDKHMNTIRYSSPRVCVHS